jgi:hypothetical protein
MNREIGNTVINLDKLDRMLRWSEVTSQVYVGYVSSENGVSLVFSEELSEDQSQFVDELLASWSDADPLHESKQERLKRQGDGAQVYDLLTAQINIENPVFPSIDSWLSAYQQIQFFRTLVQDGFFEFALRYFVKTVVPINIFSAEQVALAKGLLRVAARRYGSAEATLDAIESAEAI